MKFELEPYNRNIKNSEMISDLKDVAKKLEKESLSQIEYNSNGKFHSSTISHRFGNWARALEASGLSVRKYQIITKYEIIEDLKRVAESLCKDNISHAEYNAFGKYSSHSVLSKFNTWLFALESAGLKRTRNFGISNEEYFKNIEEIWEKLGRQPKYLEIEKPFSKYSSGSYERRFGSWRKALEAFVKFMNSDPENESSINTNKIKESQIENSQNIIIHKTKRNISWKLRFIILRRDHFKCQKCGRNPASDHNVILHVDHIIPWSKGGETEYNNLETLCMICNLGKGNSNE